MDEKKADLLNSLMKVHAFDLNNCYYKCSSDRVAKLMFIKSSGKDIGGHLVIYI